MEKGKYKLKCEGASLSGHLPSYLLIFLTNFEVYHFLMFLMISGSLIQSKAMFFDALDISEHHWNDPL